MATTTPQASLRRGTAWPGEDFKTWDLSTAARRIAAGLPTSILGMLQERLGVTRGELATVVQIAPRTLARRLNEPQLPSDESERVYRVARLFALAAEVLGSEEAAQAWMREPNYALGDEAPITLARTGPGVALVERVLGQIAHGITV